jgi:transglutaminase-like putative cysteine protease
MRASFFKRYIFLFILILVAVAAIALLYTQRELHKPVIEAIMPVSAETGDTITIYGRNFGELAGEARVEFNGVPIPRASYLEWKDASIRLVVPLLDKSPIVRVHTGFGFSKDKILVYKDNLPVLPEENAGQMTGPVVLSLEAKDAVIGGLLVIRGYNFGINRGASQVLFTTQTVLSTLDGGASGISETIAAEDEDEFVSWNDKEIQIRIPDGAVSGPIWVNTLQGQSKPQFLQLNQKAGKKLFIAKRTYALESFTTISKIKAKQGGLMYLWRKMPATSVSQRNVKVLESSYPALYSDKNITCYLIRNVDPSAEYTIVQKYLLQNMSYTVEVSPDAISVPKTDLPSLYVKYTAWSDLVPSDNDDIREYAQNAAQYEKNPYKKAALLLNALRKTYTVRQGKPDAPAQALSAKGGTVRSLVLLYTAGLRSLGIPARPIAGVLVDDTREAHEHYWCEFYIYGIGWIPVDPALYLGAITVDFSSPFSGPDKYFGSLDDRHIAFSQDLYKVARLLPEGKASATSKGFLFIDVSEEYSAEIQSYTSFWSDIEVTGIY